MNEYLTEASLGILLTQLFPNSNFIHNRTVPNSGIRSRPDYRCDELGLIVEFDGERHYRFAKKIKSEELKNITYREMGYDVVRIPYFIQASSLTLSHLFNGEFYYNQTYNHGFIDGAAQLPADFCELGINKFLEDLDRFDYIREDILESLRTKIQELTDIELVIPNSISYILNQ